LDGVLSLIGDFRDEETLQILQEVLPDGHCDLVISDMAPNLSGVASADSARMGDLIGLALDFSTTHLKPGGNLLVKCFQGSGFSQWVESFKREFRQVLIRKPKASREESSETYLLGKGLLPRPSAIP
ncbi:MAG: RlmE family RNA methyltransferase, partial [Betaproteobacteria bacterium]|nr:RlmE family RNA methyltransferase [Betaproteobacteria bacterium]